jgi:hypothetical protein
MTWASFDLSYGAKLAEQYQFGARSQHGGSCCSKAWCLCDRSGHWVLGGDMLYQRSDLRVRRAATRLRATVAHAPLLRAAAPRPVLPPCQPAARRPLAG